MKRQTTRLFLVLMVLLASSMLSIAAQARSNDGSHPYFGGGLMRSMATYKSGSANSNFNGWGGMGIIGLDLSSGAFGFFVEGEYGRGDALNTFQSATYLEKSTNTFMVAKAGISYGIFGLGGGVQQNEIDVDNVATTGTSGRTSYKGMSYLGFARLTISGGESKDVLQTVIDLKYGTGNVSGLDLTETQLSLRFVFSPF